MVHVHLSTRALFVSIANNNTTNYAQIMHEGEIIQFGDLGFGRNYTGTTSNGHGGLGEWDKYCEIL